MVVIHEPPLAPGDFVEIIGSHAEQGKRGYIQSSSTSPSVGTIYSVILDEYFCEEDRDAWFHPRTVVVDAGHVQLLWIHGQARVLSAFELLQTTAPVHGIVAASLRPPDQATRTQPDTPYGRLKRPPICELPGPHTVDLNFAKEEDRALYLELYSGNCQIWYSYHFDKTDHRLETAFPLFRVAVFKHDEQRSRSPYDSFAHCTLFVTAQKQRGFKASPSKAFQNLSLHQLQMLCNRAIHYVLRLSGSNLSFRMLYLMDSPLHVYRSEGWWKDHLDAAIVLADLAVEQHFSDDFIQTTIVMLAKALMMNKKPYTAALVCQQAAEEMVTNGPIQIAITLQAAQAFALSGVSDSAENMLFTVFSKLQKCFGKNLLKEPMFKTMCLSMVECCLMKAYGNRHSNEAEPESDYPWTTDRIVSYLYTMVCGIAFHMNLNQDGIEYDNSYLLSKLRTSNSARKAIRDAFQQAVDKPSGKESSEAFQSTVCAWANKHQSLAQYCTNFNHNVLVANMDSSKQLRKNIKNIQLDRGTLTVGCGNNKCSNMQLTTSMQMCSRCQDIFYCNRDCQVADWPRHKSHCKKAALAREKAAAAEGEEEAMAFRKSKC